MGRVASLTVPVAHGAALSVSKFQEGGIWAGSSDIFYFAPLLMRGWGGGGCRRAETGRFGSLAFAMKNRHFGGECSWILAGKARKCGRFWVFACVPNPGKQSIWRQCPPSARKQSTKKLPNRPGFTHVQGGGAEGRGNFSKIRGKRGKKGGRGGRRRKRVGGIFGGEGSLIFIHKLFGPDFPTLTPECPGVKKFLPTTGAAGKCTFWRGRPRFSARTSMTRRVVEKLCPKKVCVDFLAPKKFQEGGIGKGVFA